MKSLNFDVHFKDLFDNTSDLIHFLDIDSKILKVNPAWLNNLQFSAEEVIGKSIYEFIDPKSHEIYKNYRSSVIATNKLEDISFELRTKDGQKILAEGQIGCVYDVQEPVYTRGVFKNITSKRVAELNLEKNQRRLNTFLKSAPSAVVIIDQNQTVLEWNPKAEEIFGFKTEDVLNRPLGDIIIPPQFREAHAMGMAHFLKTGEGPVLNRTIEIEALHQKGHVFPVNLSISNVKVDDDWLFIAFISDITEHKLLQQEIIRQQAALMQSKILDEKKDEFLSMASHELKTPLTSLKAYIQLLEKSVVSGNALPVQFLGKASHYIRRLENLIADLLDVSKIKADKMIYNFEEFSFSELLSECVESVQHATESHRIEIEESAEVNCFGDKMRIEQVIHNILTNAVKYSPDADLVILKSKIIENRLLVSITDFGIGIDNKNLNNLFKRFYRVENSDMKFQGLGIGLFISSEILDRHQGEIWVESEPGQGSTFFFSLPVRGN
ncbi:sensor histidine kinase [Daejeonella oryzae]|uniref:sensor histidine kinase n=1 Tax=Daejeonella oryzae TaxID=1122943 RepID=UPI00041D8A76|nr:PAS domain-containing sensor histidine kinase [Daejeonella oryzae]